MADVSKSPLNQPPKVKCSTHPSNFLSHFLENPLNLFCGSCNKPAGMLELKVLYSQIDSRVHFIEDHLNASFKDLLALEKDQLNLISNFKGKFMEIFDQYETEARSFFLKLQQNLKRDLEVDSLSIQFHNLAIEQMDQSSFSNRLNFLNKSGVLAVSLPEKTSIVIQELKDFSNELTLFLTDSLDTLKKSYFRFSRICSEKIAQKSSVRRNSLILASPEKSLEINGLTPFAKDLVLLSRDKSKQAFTFATCSNDEKLRIWQFCEKTQGFTLQHSLNAHNDWINRLLFDAERNLLFSSSRDSTIKVWNMETFKCISSLSGHTDSVFGLSTFQNDSPILASGSYDKTIRLWDFETGELRTNVLLENSVYEIRAYGVEGVGVFLVAGDALGTLSFFHVENGIELKKRAKIKAHEGCILRLCYMEKEKNIVSSANKDKFIKIWNALTLSLVHQLSLHDERGVSGLFYEEKEEVLFTAGKDNVVKMIRTRDLEVVGEWKDSYIQFGGIAWEKERRALLTCGGKKIGSSVQMTINIRFFK